MKRVFLITAVLLVAFFVVFVVEPNDGVSNTGPVTALSSNRTDHLARDSKIIPLSGQSSMLQFIAGGHVLGFQPTKAYLASLDHALSVEFLGTKGAMPEATGTAPAPGTLSEASSLRMVLYQNLWKGISLTYESTEDGITESTYHIAPGADVSQIKLRYNVPITAQKDGSLKFTFDRGYLTESKPIAWQDVNGKRIPVTVAFKISGNEVGFSVGDYNPSELLIIDPTYTWHTFYGGNEFDYARGIAIDTSGNVYVTGYSAGTWGTPLNAHSGLRDLFVLKLNSSGAYQWHTFYGSAGQDYGYGIGIDTSGNVYVTGYSAGTWGTPLNAHSGSDDLFVLKLNSSGTYQWHSFYGSDNNDIGHAIAVDTSGNVYVTGYSYVTWGTPLNAHSGNADLFVLKLNSSGTYQWHSFYGSDDQEYGYGIAVDTSGNVYVAGASGMTWGSPLNAHSGGFNFDLLVLKLNSSGAYQWHTFYGSGSDDKGYGITVDTSGNVYVTGESAATWGSPLAAHNGNADFFVLKLNSSGAYQWHTFYGSGSDDKGYGITVDTSGNVYVTGESAATWGSPLNAHSGTTDLFVLKLSSIGTYQWHTFYGSGSDDNGYGIAVNTSGNIYVTGYSFETWGTPLNAHNDGANFDLFVLKLNDPSPLYATFTGYGLHKWNGSAWSQLTALDPASIVASGADLYANFTGYGIHRWNGSAWSQLIALDPASMVASDTTLYANFTGFGIHRWSGSAWSQLTPIDPASMIASGTDLYANFTGYGIHKWNGSAWSQLTPIDPASMVVSGTDLYANFTGYGLYKWNGSAWSHLTTLNSASMVASGTDLYAKFTGFGIHKWNGSAWSQLTALDPASMVVSGTTLYANFTGYGIHRWDGSAWSQLTPIDPARMIASGAALYVDLTGYGIYKYEAGTWTNLSPTDPILMVAGF